MLLRKDKFFNAVVLVILAVVLSYLSYQSELCEIEDVKATSVTVTAVDKSVHEYIKATYYDIPLDHQLQDFIRDQCSDAGIDIELVLAVMDVESDFQFDTVSNTHDYGIMQINRINHENLEDKLNVTDFLDPYDCTAAGIYMLGNLKWCDSESQMLMCYNMGTAGAKRKWKQGIYETEYTRKVMNAKDEIRRKRYEVKILQD